MRSVAACMIRAFRARLNEVAKQTRKLQTQCQWLRTAVSVQVGLTCKVHNIAEGKVTVRCCGLGALLQSVNRTGDVEGTSAQFDMVAAVWEKAADLPLEVSWRHIESHQDKNPWNALDRGPCSTAKWTAMPRHTGDHTTI